MLLLAELDAVLLAAIAAGEPTSAFNDGRAVFLESLNAEPEPESDNAKLLRELGVS